MHTQIPNESVGIEPESPPEYFPENNIMITRHHIALTILCALIFCSALVPFDPYLLILICTGAGIGTILPDIQMKRPRDFRIRTVAWAISRFGSTVCTPLICRLYCFLLERTCDPADKRLTHSAPGILLLWTTCAAFLLVPVFIISGSSALHLAEAFLCGVMLGLVLHLVEDMCTRKGIIPLFPFSTTMISGSIRPCDTTDRRIAQYHFYDCSVACIILGFQCVGNWPGIVSVPLCLFGLGSCLTMMVWSSDVSISREPVGITAGATCALASSDPFIRTWRAEHPALGLMMGIYYLRNNQQ